MEMQTYYCFGNRVYVSVVN